MRPRERRIVDATNHLSPLVTWVAVIGAFSYGFVAMFVEIYLGSTFSVPDPAIYSGWSVFPILLLSVVVLAAYRFRLRSSVAVRCILAAHLGLAAFLEYIFLTSIPSDMNAGSCALLTLLWYRLPKTWNAG